MNKAGSTLRQQRIRHGQGWKVPLTDRRRAGLVWQRVSRSVRPSASTRTRSFPIFQDRKYHGRKAMSSWSLFTADTGVYALDLEQKWSWLDLGHKNREQNPSSLFHLFFDNNKLSHIIISKELVFWDLFCLFGKSLFTCALDGSGICWTFCHK